VNSREQENQSHLPSPGDAFFKETFSNIPTASDFLRGILPPYLAQETVWSILKREPDSFLDANLRSKYADMLFSCRLGDKPVFYYVLLEHKTTPEYWTSFSLLELKVRIWRKHLDNSNYAVGKLPMIIPVVLHQGPKGWKHSVAFADYLDCPADARNQLEHLLVDFSHLLVDLSAIPWEEVKGEARLCLTLVLMKAVRENRVLEIFPKIVALFAELERGDGSNHFLQALATYLMETEENMPLSTIYEIANTIPIAEAKERIMKLADYIRDEGRELGREEGVLIGQIISFREILGLPSLPAADLGMASRAELEQSLARLKTQVAQALKPSAR
jgi:predicted transposase YdaD